MKYKNHMIISINEEKIWQDSVFFYDKNSQQTEYRGYVPQHNKGHLRDFPGGPVVKTPRSQCREPGFNPWSGN